MMSNMFLNYSVKRQPVSRIKALASFTALAALLFPASVYGMDPYLEDNPQKILNASRSLSSSEKENAKLLYKKGVEYLYRFKDWGAQEDKMKAMEYFDGAAQQGSAKLQYKIAEKCDFIGDQENHFKYLTLAANNPDPNQKLHVGKTPTARAQLDLANVYYFDKQNTDEAYKYYKLCSANGWGELPMINVIEDERALSKYLPLAKDGNVEAQIIIGKLFHRGIYFCPCWQGMYIDKSDEKAIQYLKPAADKEHPEAHYILGEIYEKNPELQDLNQSLTHYKTAACLGNPEAQLLLSEKYAKGEGVQKDDPQALEYLFFAAAQNHPKANVALGLRFEGGEGVEKDIHEALKYYQIAADLGDPDGQMTIGCNHLEGEFLEKDANLAVKYLTLAAEQKNIMAIFMLAATYMEGKIVPEDLKKALEYLESEPITRYDLCADQGYNKDQNFEAIKCAWGILAGIYEEGSLGVTQDIKKAIDYYKKLADAGIAEFQNKVGLLTYQYSQYPEDAFHYFQLAADQGYAEAQSSLGFCYENGLGGVQQDYRRAFEYYTLAATQGNAEAQYNLARFYKKLPKRIANGEVTRYTTPDDIL
jgi:TPR repeat protein